MLEPDDFKADPYGHITNQAGHAALVGLPLALALMTLGLPPWAAPPLAALIYAAVWEWGWQRWRYPGGFDWRDSLMDTACVMAGAAILCAALALPGGGVNAYGLTGAWVTWAAWAAVVLWGGWRRGRVGR